MIVDNNMEKHKHLNDASKLLRTIIKIAELTAKK